MDYTHFLFETGDCEKWLIAKVSAVIGENYSNSARPIVASSNNCSNYDAKWYNRSGSAEDPWISADDHSDAINNDSILYGENKFGNSSYGHTTTIRNHNGVNVFVGKLKE